MPDPGGEHPATRLDARGDVRRRHLRGDGRIPVQHLLERTASVAGVVSHVVHLVGLGPRHADGRGLRTAGGEGARGRGEVRERFGVCGAGDGGALVANPRRRCGAGRFASDDGAPGRVF